MAEAVVQLLEAVEVAEDEAERAPVARRARDLAVEPLDERAPVEQARQRIVVGEEAQLVRGAADATIAAAAWFAKTRSAWSVSCRRQQRGRSGSSAQSMPITSPAPSCSGTSSQWWFQARGPRPFCSRRTAVGRGAMPPLGLVVREQVAALDLERRIEQRFDVAQEDAAPTRAASSRFQPTAARGSRRPGRRVASAREHVLEAERVAHAEADRAQDLVASTARRSAATRRSSSRSSASAVPRGLACLLRRLHRERGVLRERDEHVELFVGRPPPAHRLVDGEDAEQVAVRVAHRQEERVLGMPAVLAAPGRRVGHVAAVAELASQS